MNYVIVALMEAVIVIVGLIPPVAVCNFVCRFSGISRPSIKRTLIVIVVGLIISTFVEMVLRKFIIFSDATSIFIFCMSLLITFTILWLACHKITPREAALLAGVLMVVILIYTLKVPHEYNAYTTIRAGIGWVVDHF